MARLIVGITSNWFMTGGSRSSKSYLVLMRYAVLVTGPAGAGKSTFSTAFATHLRVSKRTAHIVNLDPAATGDAFEYLPAIDIRELVTLDDVMGEMNMGPNGGLVYCFE